MGKGRQADAKQGWTFEVVSDLGSGINYQKKGLKRLLNAIIDDKVGRLVLTHKDCLLRFGAELVFAICEIKSVQVIILNQGEDTTFEEDLAQDVLEIITVFSARLYGSRSRKNQKIIEGVKKVIDMIIAHKNAPQMAIIQLSEAFKNFFAGRASYPQFKKKGRSHDSFTRTNDQFVIKASRIRTPNLGWVRMRESLRFSGEILSATISRTADRWYASINIETEDKSHLPKAENQGMVGVDLGLKALATLSTGELITGAKPLKRLMAKHLAPTDHRFNPPFSHYRD